MRVLIVLIAVHSGAFLYKKHESKCRVAVEIVSMQALALEKSKSLIKFHGCRVGDFCFKCDLSPFSISGR